MEKKKRREFFFLVLVLVPFLLAWTSPHLSVIFPQRRRKRWPIARRSRGDGRRCAKKEHNKYKREVRAEPSRCNNTPGRAKREPLPNFSFGVRNSAKNLAGFCRLQESFGTWSFFGRVKSGGRVHVMTRILVLSFALPLFLPPFGSRNPCVGEWWNLVM